MRLARAVLLAAALGLAPAPSLAVPADASGLEGLLAALEGPVGDRVAALLQEPAPEPGEPAEGEAEAPEERPRRRSRVERLAQRLSVGTTIEVKEGTWSAWLRIRYARAVRYEFDHDLYSLTESYEIVPGTALTDQGTIPEHVRLWQGVLEKPFRFTVRRIRYRTWGAALFAKPYPIGRLPVSREKALSMQPGDSATVSSGLALFVGGLLFSENREWRGNARAGLVMPADYDATVERLIVPGEGPGEWVLSVGGTVRRQWTFRYRLRSPRVLSIRSLRLFDVSWNPADRGLRFAYTSEVIDLTRPELGPLFRGIMTGAARLPDVALFGQTFRVFLRREIDERTMEAIQDLAEFRRVARLSEAEAEVDWTRALTGLRGRDFEMRLWILVYRLSWTIERSDDETLVDPKDARGGRFHALTSRRDNSRGWLFFPRESQRLEVTTLQDARTGEMVTEALVELHDQHRRVREASRDSGRIRAFLGGPVLDAFPVEPPAVYDPSGRVFLVPGLPDLDRVPSGKDRAAVILRWVLGDRFHPPGSDRRTRALALHRAFRRAFARGVPEPGDLVARLGTQDSFASFRIEIGPHDRKGRARSPSRVFVGSTGRPERDVRNYARLRRLFDAAAAVY